jgi:hypothetical protein
VTLPWIVRIAIEAAKLQHGVRRRLGGEKSLGRSHPQARLDQRKIQTILVELRRAVDVVQGWGGLTHDEIVASID